MLLCTPYFSPISVNVIAVVSTSSKSLMILVSKVRTFNFFLTFLLGSESKRLQKMWTARSTDFQRAHCDHWVRDNRRNKTWPRSGPDTERWHAWLCASLCDGPVRSIGVLRCNVWDWSLSSCRTSNSPPPLSLSLARSQVIVVVTQQNLEA